MMENTEEQKYLGFLVSSSGNNKKHIAEKRGKGLGIVKQISAILENITFGYHKYKVAVLLRNSLFINSILSNAEVWYSVSTSEIEQLEEIDEMLLRNILSAPRSTPRPLLYLEMECIPIRFILKTRRLMYLKYILDEDEQSLIHSVFQAQVNLPLKGDWCTSVSNDLEELELSNLTYKSIKDMTKASFKSQVNDAVVSASLTYLLNWKTNMTK